MFPALKEAIEKLDAKRTVLKAVFDEAGPTYDMDLIKSVPGDSADKVKWISEANDELTDLGKSVDDLKAIDRAADAVRGMPEQRSGSGPDDDNRPAGPKSFGEALIKSAAYTERQGKNGPEAHLDVELKTLMTTVAGWAPETTRTGTLIPFATRPLQVTDLIPTTTTRQNSVVYMEETTFTNNAAEVAEGGTYGEAALALTEQNSPVRKVGVWLPVTDEQLEDEDQARGYIDNRLPFMVRQRLDGQILVGNGTSPNLRGVNNVVGVQVQPKGADPVPDAIYKGLVLVRVTGRALPDAVVIHPLDWQDIRLLRTADGIYIWGNPSDAGPERIWGLGVVQSDAQTQNTAVVGDFANFSELSVRRGVDVQITNSHGTFFVEGKQAIRADLRAALIFYRPAAFCQVTGI
jgi:HK97 family phage major capsid protein